MGWAQLQDSEKKRKGHCSFFSTKYIFMSFPMIYMLLFFTITAEDTNLFKVILIDYYLLVQAYDLSYGELYRITKVLVIISHA